MRADVCEADEGHFDKIVASEGRLNVVVEC